jgi:hypothetical protein
VVSDAVPLSISTNLGGAVVRKPRVTAGALIAVAKKTINGTKADLKNPSAGEEENKKNAAALAHCNRTGTFTPPHHFSFTFCSKNKDRVLYLAFNIPSGVSYGWLGGMIHALVSDDHPKLILSVSGPEFLHLHIGL